MGLKKRITTKKFIWVPIWTKEGMELLMKFFLFLEKYIVQPLEQNICIFQIQLKKYGLEKD